MEALRGGVRPSKDDGSHLWDKLSCQEILGARGHCDGPWRRIFGGKVCHEKGDMLRSHLQPERLRPRSGPSFIVIETFVVKSLAKNDTSASGVNNSLVWCAGVIEKKDGERSGGQ